MSIDACAALVERADPIRFRAAMAAPVAARRVLFPLYAFNVEVSRAPWVTQEDMIAEMRLQWWRDALEEIAAGGRVRKHEVVDALADAITAEDAQLLDGLVAARRWDIFSDSFEDADHLVEYLDATAGHLMWVAARRLGHAPEQVVRDFAYASGVAGWLQAAAELESRGRRPLIDGTPAGIASLAQTGLDRLQVARLARRSVSSEAGAALLPGFQTGPLLRKAVARPDQVAAGGLALGPLQAGVRLAHVSLRGWWV